MSERGQVRQPAGDQGAAALLALACVVAVLKLAFTG